MREHNGYVDDGRRVGGQAPCPNCGSARYFQTVSLEHCPACGLRCDYWGEGANDVYERMLERDAAREEERRAREREAMDHDSF